MNPRKRPKLTTEALDEFFTATEREHVPSPYDDKYARRTYRIPEELHERLKAIAEQEGVGLNDLVRYLFQTFLRQYEAGEIHLPVQEYVVTRSRLSE